MEFALYMLGAMCSSAMLSIMSAVFNRRNAGKPHTSGLYNLIVTSSAFISWGVLYVLDFGFDAGVLLYSLFYGILYAAAMLGLFQAIGNGSVSMTAFIKQLSMIGVAIWGFIFWAMPITLNIMIGMVLILAALWFCFKPDKTEKNRGITLKWVLGASMLLFGNIGCSVIQKYQQMAFDGKYKSMLMFFAIGIAVLTCAVNYAVKEKPDWRGVMKSSWYIPAIAGLSSTLLNYLTLRVMSSSYSTSVFFSVIAIGGLMLTVLFSAVVQKEKLRPSQWIGLSIGAVALVFLNI